MGPRATRTQVHEHQWRLDPQSSPSQTDPGRNPRERDTRVPLKNYPVDKNQISQPYPRRVQNYPPGDSARITRGLGGYTRWVRSHAPSGELKYPPSDSAQITRGLGGYTHWVRSRAPSGELKQPPGDSAQITQGLGATPIGCAHAHPLANQNTPGRFCLNHPGARGLLSRT